MHTARSFDHKTVRGLQLYHFLKFCAELTPRGIDMSQLSIRASVPRVNFRGVKDASAVNLNMPLESLPQRLPLFMSFAPWGDEGVIRYLNGDSLSLTYGSDVVNPKSKFFTHQSQFIRAQLTGGGKILFLRVVPEDAAQATFRLAVDVVADDIPLYERNVDGTYRLDSNYQKIPTGSTVSGYRLQWRFIEVPKVAGVSNYGSGSQIEGGMISSESGAVSTLIPILDGLARHRGVKGNNLGLRLFAPTINSIEPADADLNESVGSFIYRMQVIERSTSTSSASVKRTLMGMDYLDFSFVQGAIDPETETEYYLGKVLKPAFESTDPATFTGYGAFDKVHVYNQEITNLLNMLAETEADYTGEEIANPNLINFLTGVNVEGVPYHTFVVEGPAAGGLLFTESSNYYMQGGADGTITPAKYNQLIGELLDSVDSSPIPFKNIARVPCDSVWDSGFPLEIKRKFSVFHSIRPDVHIHICTQDVSKPVNTPAEDTSAAIALRSHFRALQESSEFGTKALRVTVMGNAGYLVNDNYDGVVPFLEYLCYKGAEYMGAEDGSMKADKSFGRGEQNYFTRYRDHNAGDKDITAKSNDWNNGLNYAEWYDMSRLFWPALQSIYEDHTSILHSYLNTCIACNLTRIGHMVWREMSGDSQLTDQEFLDAVEQKVQERVAGKYDNRVDITPSAYFTDLDDALGYPWHLDIAMAGDNIRSVENLSIIAQRRRNEETV